MQESIPTPVLLGVLNITEDSFSDGGKYLDPQAMRMRIRHLLSTGAAILDLGAASSNPNGQAVAAETEIARLQKGLDIIAEEEADSGQSVAISVDSFHPEVQRFALQRGVDYLNDIHGFPDPALYEELAASNCKLIVMHAVQSSGVADKRDVDPASIIDRILGFFQERLAQLESAGVRRNRIILDPGMGFFLGSNADCSFSAIAHVELIKSEFNLPLLYSVSRKSFLGAITGREVSDRQSATLAAELFLALKGVDYIRTHEPAPLIDALKVWNAIQRQPRV